jgi:hypothetical protein
MANKKAIMAAMAAKKTQPSSGIVEKTKSVTEAAPIKKATEEVGLKESDIKNETRGRVTTKEGVKKIFVEPVSEQMAGEAKNPKRFIIMGGKKVYLQD